MIHPAYSSSREDFDAYRGKLSDQAVAAHERGDHAEAWRLLHKRESLRYTGLCWQIDNGLMEDPYVDADMAAELMEAESRA